MKRYVNKGKGKVEEKEVVKKKRGRRSKAEIEAAARIAQTVETGAEMLKEASQEVKKKRGRKPKSESSDAGPNPDCANNGEEMKMTSINFLMPMEAYEDICDAANYKEMNIHEIMQLALVNLCGSVRAERAIRKN